MSIVGHLTKHYLAQQATNRSELSVGFPAGEYRLK